MPPDQANLQYGQINMARRPINTVGHIGLPPVMSYAPTHGPTVQANTYGQPNWQPMAPGYGSGKLSGDWNLNNPPFYQPQPVPTPYPPVSSNLPRTAGNYGGEQTWNTVPPFPQNASAVPGTQVGGFGEYGLEKQWNTSPPLGNVPPNTFNLQNSFQQASPWRPMGQSAPLPNLQDNRLGASQLIDP